jgi:hypothetical protein
VTVRKSGPPASKDPVQKDPVERDLEEALGILHYYLALNSPMSRNWAARARRRSQVLGISVPAVTDAVDILNGNVREGGGEGVEHLRRHANAALAQVHNQMHRDPSNRRLSRSLRSYLKKVHAPRGSTFIDQIEARSPPGRVLGQAYDPNVSLEITGPADLDEAGVTRFYAKVTRKRGRHERFQRVAETADPQNWHKVYPQQFPEAYDCDDFFGSRYEMPRHKPGAVLGKTWSGLLAEVFQWSFWGADLAAFRNLLRMDFKANPTSDDNGTIEFKYSLYESLTNSVFDGRVSPGGIDVDSNDAGSSSVSLTRDQITIQAGKNIRFSRDTGIFQDELNLVALPAVTMWIIGLLLTAPTSTST